MYRTVSGRLFKYGNQYFKMPIALEELVIEKTVSKWPGNWTASRCHDWIKEVLQQYRMVRARQMEVWTLN